jgi:hypothetical protein
LGLFGVNHLLAAIAISNLATLLAAYMLYRLVLSAYGPKAGRWTLLFWLCYPMSFFGSVAYAEAVLALCIVLALGNVMQEHFLCGGFWSALAAATRPTGVALGAAFLPGLCRRNRWWAFAGMALCGASVAIYFGYLGYKFGDPLLYLHSEWVAETSDSNSLNPLVWAKKLLIGVCVAIRLMILREPEFELYSGRLTNPFLYVWILAWLPGVRRLGSEMAWFASALCIMPLATMDTAASLGRYSWLVIPVFIAQGVQLKESKLRFMVLAVSVVVMLWSAALYGGGWVMI